jgi:adenylyltransferase/sulfurtransferase
MGEAGQTKLAVAKVLIVGVGGLGCPVALYLAAAGVGQIGIVDEDRIEIHNLQRQILYDTYYLGRPKVEIAAEKLVELNDEIKITAYDLKLNINNAKELIEKYDIIADCSDNFEARFLLNDVCMELGKTLVSAAVAGFEGQLYTFKAGIANYRDIYDEPPEGLIPSCSQNGIMGSVCGAVGSMQATEIIKEICGIGKSLAGSFLSCNFLTNTIKTIKIN